MSLLRTRDARTEQKEPERIVRRTRRAAQRDTTARADERASLTEHRDELVAPVETQQVVAPDQDMLADLNARESMGFGGFR